MIKDMIPLDQVLHKRASLTPRTTFIKFNGKKHSYREINRLSDLYARTC